MVKRRGEALCDAEAHAQKAREGSHLRPPSLSNLLPAPAYSGEETGRLAQFAARNMRQIGSLAVPRFAGF